MINVDFLIFILFNVIYSILSCVIKLRRSKNSIIAMIVIVNLIINNRVCITIKPSKCFIRLYQIVIVVIITTRVIILTYVMNIIIIDAIIVVVNGIVSLRTLADHAHSHLIANLLFLI